MEVTYGKLMNMEDKENDNENERQERLKERKKFSIDSISHFIPSPEKLLHHSDSPLFLMSPSDVGVYRNGGRRGSQFAPSAIWAVLKKMVKPPKLNFIQLVQVTSLQEEEINFSNAQEKSAKIIHHSIQKTFAPVLFHIGGGHDQIYPLLSALEKSGRKKLTVINIDAHCDTRTDKWPHSGNPFRQFAQETQTDFHLIQLGIHRFSNDANTISPLSRGRMTIFTFQEILEQTSFFRRPFKYFLDEKIDWENDRSYVLSLDCDALDSSFMEGVSAVNHHGFPLLQLQEIFKWYGEKATSNKSEKGGVKFQELIYGIYEYNPLFDNLSQKGARALAGLIYQVMEDQLQNLNNLQGRDRPS